MRVSKRRHEFESILSTQNVLATLSDLIKLMFTLFGYLFTQQHATQLNTTNYMQSKGNGREENKKYIIINQLRSKSPASLTDP